MSKKRYRDNIRPLRLSTPVWNSIVAMITSLWCHSFTIRDEHGIQCMPCFSRIIGEMLPEIQTVEKVLLSQTYSTFSNNVIVYYYSMEFPLSFYSPARNSNIGRVFVRG